MRLIDERTPDGSRRFARVPWAGAWKNLFRHLFLLPGAAPADGAHADSLMEKLDFYFHGHQFQVVYCGEELHLVVRDPLCSDQLLFQVAYHLNKLPSGRV